MPAAVAAVGARLVVAGGFAAGIFVAAGGCAFAAGVNGVAAAAGACLVAGADDVAAAAGACLVAAFTALGALRFFVPIDFVGFPSTSSLATGPCRVFGGMIGWCSDN